MGGVLLVIKPAAIFGSIDSGNVLSNFSYFGQNERRFLKKFPIQLVIYNTLDQEHNQDQNRRLRNEDDLYEPYARLDFTARLPYFSFPKLWNPLHIDCKTSLSLKILCNKLKSMYLENYLNISRCNRLFCPICRLNT
jgi:hypothetical protein